MIRAFGRLSGESRYRTFLVPSPELSERMLRYLTNVDRHDHEAMVAVDEPSGEGLGVARYVRDLARPERAEVAVTVTDDRQGAGLGTLLLDVISARARDEGVRTFTAIMLAENQEMRDLFERLGLVRTVDQDRGVIEVEVKIPAVGLAPELKTLLGVAARGDLALPATTGHGSAEDPPRRGGATA